MNQRDRHLPKSGAGLIDARTANTVRSEARGDDLRHAQIEERISQAIPVIHGPTV
jgi:hypothetical protein